MAMMSNIEMKQAYSTPQAVTAHENKQATELQGSKSECRALASEVLKGLKVTGYLLAVNLPSTIHPPRSRRTGVPVNRYDVIGYVGDFPSPLHTQYLKALEDGDRGVLYLRELDKDETRFAPRAYEYSLGIPTSEGQRNITGLEPCFFDGAWNRQVFVGAPEAKEVRGTKHSGATYIIIPCNVAGRRGYEILCTTHPYGRMVAHGVARGVYRDLLDTLRAQTSPLGWQVSDATFMEWYSVAEVHG